MDSIKRERGLTPADRAGEPRVDFQQVCVKLVAMRERAEGVENNLGRLRMYDMVLDNLEQLGLCEREGGG